MIEGSKERLFLPIALIKYAGSWIGIQIKAVKKDFQQKIKKLIKVISL